MQGALKAINTYHTIAELGQKTDDFLKGFVQVKFSVSCEGHEVLWGSSSTPPFILNPYPANVENMVSS